MGGGGQVTKLLNLLLNGSKFSLHKSNDYFN